MSLLESKDALDADMLASDAQMRSIGAVVGPASGTPRYSDLPIFRTLVRNHRMLREAHARSFTGNTRPERARYPPFREGWSARDDYYRLLGRLAVR